MSGAWTTKFIYEYALADFEALHRRAVDRHLRTDRRGLSLVDCASFVVMDEERIREALALDADFATEGFRLIPG